LGRRGKDKEKGEKTMKLKKLSASLLALGMVLVLMTGCGNGNGEKIKDITVVSREDGSGTRSAFVELFGVEEEVDGTKMDMTTDEAQITNSTSVVMTAVANDEYAIGYISLGAMSDTVKALRIDGVEATADNVKNGSYKISRPFQIAVKQGAQNEVTEDFINFILSQDGQAVVMDNSYIPIDTAEAFQSNNASGKIVVGGSSSVAPVMEKLAEAYRAFNTNAKIELQVTDSTTGMSETINGNYDIGMASRELKDTELAGGLNPQIIALDGIAVIVNTDNTVDELSNEQVKEIYTGEVLTWNEVEE